MPTNLTFSPSTVHTDAQRLDAVPVVNFGTSLLELTQLFARFETRHLFVRDHDGNMVGIISTTDLQEAIRDFDNKLSPNWHSRSVESLLHVNLVDETQLSHELLPGSPAHIDCLSVTEGSSLVALLTNDDVLFSWNRLEPALSRASLDALTQLPNRAHFERRFETEWQRAERQGLSLGVLLIDVDHFKEINDRFGHLRGDMVLTAIAQICEKQLRSYDVVARFAGDEFIALTSGCGADDIDLPIRRLQEATREMSLAFGEHKIPVSLSIGASVICSGYDRLAARDMIEAADRCLYIAKEKGRDRAYRVELLPDGSLTPEIRVDAALNDANVNS